MANLAHPAFQGTFEPELGKDAEVEAGFREPGNIDIDDDGDGDDGDGDDDDDGVDDDSS